MPFHIITLKKQKCQDVKMSRLQGLFFFQYIGYIARKLAVGANRNYFPAFNIILGWGDNFNQFFSYLCTSFLSKFNKD